MRPSGRRRSRPPTACRTPMVMATEKSEYTLRLEPKNDSGGLSEILMGVSRSSADIVWASVRDASGNLTTIRFSSMRKGVGLKDPVFIVQIPTGADVVELGQ